MNKVLKQTMIGLTFPMVSFALLTALFSFLLQKVLWQGDMFWLVFRTYVCVSLFTGFCRGFFTYLEVTENKDA